jgi:hypothetical protein
MKRLVASDDKKVYRGLTNLLSEVSDKCNTYANMLERKNSISLIQEFQENLGHYYRDDVGTDLGEDVNLIVEQLREIANKLDTISFDVAETARIGE